MNTALMVLYVFTAVIGSTLIKYGSVAASKALFTLPIVNMSVTPITLFGIMAYGISFLTYIVLLTRFDLSFISPLLVGFVYVLLMITARVFFKEEFTMLKIIGCTLILVGIMLVLLKK